MIGIRNRVQLMKDVPIQVEMLLIEPLTPWLSNETSYTMVVHSAKRLSPPELHELHQAIDKKYEGIARVINIGQP